MQTSVELDSMVSGSSRRKPSGPNNSFSVDDMEGEEESEGVGVKDVKQILPTCLILLITLVITVTVIPYAFSSVIKCGQSTFQILIEVLY